MAGESQPISEPCVPIAAPPLAGGEALVSVVVPCFDTVRYLDDCLASLVRQTYRTLEIVAVDDGSTDGSASALRRWALADERIRVTTQPNGGLGQARNAGVAVMTGDYLMFVDSDDLLPDDAIERMVTTLERTGSDFVSGVADRFDSRRRWRSSLYGEDFAADSDRTHVYDRPGLLHDHIVCSKLFRTEFWKRNDFRFPEGTLFEDIEVATRAHTVAASVDLISDPTYLWRSRDEGTLSITQDRRRPGSVSARFRALGDVDAFLRTEAPADVWYRHGVKLISVDMRLYARELLVCDDSYDQEYFASAGPVLDSVAPDAPRGVGVMVGMLRDAVIAGDARACRALLRLIEPHGRLDRLRGVMGLRWRLSRQLGAVFVRRRIRRER